MYLRERWQGSGGPDGVVSPLSAQPNTPAHRVFSFWLTGACWLDGRAVPSVAAAEEEDADALELDSAPALLLPLGLPRQLSCLV